MQKKALPVQLRFTVMLRVLRASGNRVAASAKLWDGFTAHLEEP